MDSIHDHELFEAFATASENVYIFVCDMKTDISRWSVNAVDYFDLEDEYIEHAGEKWVEKIHPADREMYLEDIGGIFTGAKDRHSCQYRAVNKFGEYVWLECKGTVIKDSDGEANVFAGLMTRLDGQNKYDSLTNLMTIYEFYKRDFSEEKGAVLLLGIDDFRRVINNYGYNFGDDILVDFSKRLTDLCGERTAVFRFHGDEFLITLPCGDREEVQRFYKEIKQMAECVGPQNGRHISLSVSAGAVICPEDGASKEELVNNLKHSLEYAKQKDRGNLVFFSQEIFELHRRSRILLDDLRESIQNGFAGFELHFQPLVVPGTREIAGCESLLRWKGTHIKDSYPGEFIEVLEYYGLIGPVGDWVMEEAMKQQKAWEEKYGDIYVSFNVSYQQFLAKGFVDKLIRKGRKYQVNPSHIIVELTESCKVEQPEELAAMFRKLRSEGYRMALDDFGTAYSSLELLKKLPTDFIKIEHSFVRELTETGHEIDRMIIENLLGLCRRLNYCAIVEGVENEKVDEIVSRMDATYLQGYCYSKPVCKEVFENMLQNNL